MQWTTYGLTLALVPMSVLLLVAAAWLAAHRSRSMAVRWFAGLGVVVLLAVVVTMMASGNG